MKGTEGTITTEIKIPELGENIESAEVLAVLVKVGEWVERDQPIIELETDKAPAEVPAETSGVVVEVLVKEGQTVKVGAPIFRLEDAAEKPGAAAAAGKSGDAAAGKGAARKSARASGEPVGSSTAVAEPRGAAPLVGGGFDPNTGGLLEPAFAGGLEHNRASIVSNDGHILINTNPRDAGRQSTNIETLSSLLPASFEARADHGTIQIRSNLTFLPSPTGSVRFFARQDIQGVPKLLRADDPNFIWLYVGYGGLAGGQWVAVDQRTLPHRPDLWPFLANRPGSATLPPRPAQDQAPPSLFPESAKIDVVCG